MYELILFFSLIDCYFFPYPFAQPTVADLSSLQATETVAHQRDFVNEMLDQAKGGVKRKVSIDGRVVAQLTVAKGVWGGARAEDMAAVCESVMQTICKVIPPNKGREPECIVVYSKRGPMVLSRRGPKGEYIVLLNTQGRVWAQVAYQFSHEIGHVLCGDLSLKMPQHWFEEAFCEAMSLWTMETLSQTWKQNPPYANWKSYAPYLKKYVDQVGNRIDAVDDLQAWYLKHRNELTANAYDRDKNLVLAKWIVKQAKKDKQFLRAFYFMRPREEKKQVNRMASLISDWKQMCPEHLQFCPDKIAETLGINE